MRDIYTRVNNLRRQVFSAVANLAYEDRDLSEIVEIPFEILPGEIASIRESVFLERAILGERIRAALDWTSSRQESTYQSQQVLTK